MYCRNCGSNWPRSCALIARSTRGSALIGPGPISRRGAGLICSAMGMVLQPVARDVDAARDPHFAFPARITQKALQRSEASRPADEAAMQADRHHAPALGMKNVERVLQVIEELLAGIEALRRREAHVVGVERIWNHELRLAIAKVVPRQIVVVVVGVVHEAAILDHQAPGVGAGAPGVPAERPLAGQAPLDLDRALHVLALGFDGHVLVVYPAPAVVRDLVAGFHERFYSSGVS